MKHLLTLYLTIFSGGSYAQTRPNKVVAEVDFSKQTVIHFDNVRRDTFYVTLLKPDTLRATLLITRGHMQMAHEKPGYVVYRSKDTVYLDDKRMVLKAPVKVWAVKIENK